MKNILFYIGYDCATVILFVGIPTCTYSFIKGKPFLWRILFAAEVVLLFISAANCFVPGSWKDFWISESVNLGLATTTAFWSYSLSRRAESAPKLYTRLVTPQIFWLFAVVAFVSWRIYEAGS